MADRSRSSRDIRRARWSRWMLVVGAALAALGSGARASVLGTAHETELGGEGGVCAACHIPHQAAGEKFWPVDPVYEGKVGTVAALCGSCHHSGEGYGALMTRAHSDDFVYGPNSHGQKMYLADPPPSTDVFASGLPAVDKAHGYFECSTCHSVHDDTYRPFLRDKPDALCARCHRLRHYVNGLERSGIVVDPGNWGIPSRLGRGNPGAHPVGEDVVPGRADGPVVSIGSIFRIPFSREPGRWSLGGHLSAGSSGGVTCLTCHAVHGIQPDPDDVVAAGIPEPPPSGMLVVAQAEGNLAGASRAIPNGIGDHSALCEACHGVGNNPPTAPDGTPWADPAHNVNPGRPGTFSHPVDTYPSYSDTGVTSFPSGWPPGDPALARANTGPVAICGTCHAAHPAAAAAAGRPDVVAGAGAFLLRAPLDARGTEPFCERCHKGGSVAGHHPTGKSYDSTGVKYLKNASGGPSDTLTCSTCHAGGTNGAHNWHEPSAAGLDENWLPRDNGRSPVQASDMYHRDMSKTCMDCHYFMDGDGTTLSPTLGARQTVITSSDDESIHYQIPSKGVSTHYIGRIHEDGTLWRDRPLLDVFDTSRTWSSQAPGMAAGLADGWARYGGENRNGARVLVCESCHELEPNRNRRFRHLLLAPYEEGQNGLDEYPGDADGRDVLCEACHGFPLGSHPLTGTLILDKYTGQRRPLDTDTEGMLPVILGYATLDRSRDALSCDGCHQPHDANPNSLTFILDAPEAGPIGPHPEDPVGPGVVDETRPAELSAYGYRIGGDGKAGGYATPTLSDKGGEHAGLCRQCHTY